MTNCLFCLINSPDPKIFSKQEIKCFAILYKQDITEVANCLTGRGKRKVEKRQMTKENEGEMCSDLTSLSEAVPKSSNEETKHDLCSARRPRRLESVFRGKRAKQLP